MKAYFNNQNGLTLLEVLLAFSILTIVFIAFLTLFPQVGTFNQITDEKMKAINVAKQQLVIVQNDFGEKFLDNIMSDPQPVNVFDKNNPDYALLNLVEDISEEGDYYRLLTQRQDLLITMKIKKNPQISGARQLYKVETIVEDNNVGRELTILYGYIIYRNGGN